MLRFETDSRYYLCAVQQDLFGHWELWRAWGAKGSALGNSQRLVADSQHHAAELLEETIKQRLAHGYTEVRPHGCFQKDVPGSNASTHASAP